MYTTNKFTAMIAALILLSFMMIVSSTIVYGEKSTSDSGKTGDTKKSSSDNHKTKTSSINKEDSNNVKKVGKTITPKNDEKKPKHIVGIDTAFIKKKEESFKPNKEEDNKPINPIPTIIPVVSKTDTATTATEPVKEDNIKEKSSNKDSSTTTEDNTNEQQQQQKIDQSNTPLPGLNSPDTIISTPLPTGEDNQPKQSQETDQTNDNSGNNTSSSGSGGGLGGNSGSSSSGGSGNNGTGGTTKPPKIVECGPGEREDKNGNCILDKNCEYKDKNQTVISCVDYRTKHVTIHENTHIGGSSSKTTINNNYINSPLQTATQNNNIFNTVYNPLTQTGTTTAPATLLLLDSKQLLDLAGDTTDSAIQMLFCTTSFKTIYSADTKTWFITGTTQNINTISQNAISGISVTAVFYDANGNRISTIQNIPVGPSSLAHDEQGRFTFSASLDTELLGQQPTFITINYNIDQQSS